MKKAVLFYKIKKDIGLNRVRKKYIVQLAIGMIYVY